MGVWWDPNHVGWRYDFRYLGQRHRSPRGFRLKKNAEDAERALRDKLERQAHGLDVSASTARAPRFSEWAGVYWTWVQQQHADGVIKHPERIHELLTVVLRFWGTRPSKRDTTKPTENAPFYDLRLDDPILDPTWLGKWEEWVRARGVAKHTRNHYLTTLSRLYWFALLAEHRSVSLVAFNPFAGRPRLKGRRRTAIVEPDQIERWMQHASYHVRLAMSIAALAHKLRLQNILQLTWSQIDFERRVITVADHKTNDDGHPLLVAMSWKLVKILQAARQRAPHAKHVITYQFVPVKTIDTGVKNAAVAAGIPYGRDTADGVTFHSLRHAVNTWLGRAGTTAQQQRNASGHRDLETTLYYTHLNVEDQRPVQELVADHLPADLDRQIAEAPMKIGRKPPHQPPHAIVARSVKAK
jgi:integrase